MSVDRRTFLAGLAAASAGGSALVAAQSSAPRVVVVGGGFGGATVAKYLRFWSGGELNVTLVDSRPFHTSCVMSNLVLNNRLSLQELRFDYNELTANYGISFLHDTAVGLNPRSQRLFLRSRQVLDYDFLVLATGVSFIGPEGWDPSLIPHAWIAGRQTLELRRQLQTLRAGGSFLMTIPPSPYRCPPGPYERACLVADIVKRRGGGKVVVLDANASIQAEPETFGRAFSELYGDIIEYYTDVTVESVDSAARVVTTSLGDFTADVVNIIPPHQASQLIHSVGLADSSGWAPVDPVTYASTLPGYDNIHVIGDSQGTGQPKSGHIANAEAKVCADAIIRLANGSPTHGDERLQNLTTNSACYSPITYDTASWLTAVFKYDMDAGQMSLTHIGEAGEWTRGNFSDMFDWSENLFTDTFA